MTFVIISGGIDLSVGSLRGGCRASSLGAALHAGLPVAVAIAVALGVGFGVRPAQRRGDHLGTAAAVHRHARHDERRARLRAAVHRRPSDLRVRRRLSRDLRPARMPACPRRCSCRRRLPRRAFRPVAHAVRALRRMRSAATRRPRGCRACNVRFHKTLVYGVSGLASAVAAVLLTARLNSAQPIAGIMYELDAIAATVIGGTSLMGGEGRAWRHHHRRADHGRAAQRAQPARACRRSCSRSSSALVIIVRGADRHRAQARTDVTPEVGGCMSMRTSLLDRDLVGARSCCPPSRLQSRRDRRRRRRRASRFVLKTLNSPFFLDMQRGAQEAAERAGRRPRRAGGRARDRRRAADADHREPDPDAASTRSR